MKIVASNNNKKTIKMSKAEWTEIGKNAGWIKKAQLIPNKPAQFEYNINLDERGYFYADVRDMQGNTVFEIKAGNSKENEDDSDIFEDGFMKNKNDIVGLKEYLVGLGIMKPNQVLIKA